MSNETMPRLRQYLRERGDFDDVVTSRYNDAIRFSSSSLRKFVVISRVWKELPKAYIGTFPKEDDYLVSTTDEQAAIDWLEANYPKEETK
jgi:hypothetical protein